MRAQFSPTYSRVPKIQSLNTSHVGATNLKHAHVFTSIGHPDGRDYASPDDYPMLPVYEIYGVGPSDKDHETAESGNVTSHNGLTYDGTSWYTADNQALYKWSAIGATPTADGTNPSNGTPFSAVETETGESGFDHIGGIAYAEISGTGYIIAPLVNNPGKDPSGIAFYGTDLSYVAGSYNALTPANYASAVAVDTVKNKLYYAQYITDSITNIYGGSLSDALSGSYSVTETITLNFPVYNVQGIFINGDDLLVEWNDDGGWAYVTAFDFDGNPKWMYRIHSISGPEDIHVVGDTLYWLSSPAVGEGYIKTLNLAAAREPGSRPDGRRIHNPDVGTSVPDSAMLTMKKAAVGEQGTWVRRIKMKTAATGMVGQSALNNDDDWNMEVVLAGGNARMRFFLNAGGGTLIETSAAVDANDDFPVDEEHTVAITWNRNAGGDTDIEIFLDGVSKDSANDAISANWSDLQFWGMGRGYLNSKSADFEIFHDYVYDAVLDADTLLAIHNDPYGMWVTE